MHVLHITGWYPNRIVPHETPFIVRHIRALEPHCHNTTWHIDARPGKRWGFIRKGIKADRTFLLTAPISRWFILEWLSTFLILWAWLTRDRSQRVDVVNFHITYPNCTHIRLLRSVMRRPIVMTEQWSIYHVSFKSGSRGLNRIRRIFHAGIPVIVVSKALENDISVFAGPPLPKFYIVDNLVEPEVFSYRPEVLPQEGVFFTIAGWRDPKRPDTLIEAMALMRDRGLNARLRIAGIGPKLPAMHDLVRRLGLEEQVDFIGQVSPAEAAKEMRNAHALVHSSDYETFSAVCAEALCCGTPVIASNVGGIPGFVSEDRGVLVPDNTAETWARVWSAAWPEVLRFDRKEFAAAMTDRVKAERVGAQYFEILKEVVATQDKALRSRGTPAAAAGEVEAETTVSEAARDAGPLIGADAGQLVPGDGSTGPGQGPIHVLHITKWFPNHLDPYEAMFIDRHIRALARHCRNTTWHIETKIGERWSLQRRGPRADRTFFMTTPLSRWLVIEWISTILILWAWITRDRSKPVDLVNFHIAYPNCVHIRFLRWIMRRPIVITEHWSAYHFSFRTVSKGLNRIRSIFHAGVPVIVVSKALKEDILKFAGPPEPRTYIVDNVVEPDLFHHRPDVTPKTGVFFTIAGWRNPKRPDLLLEAMVRLRNEGTIVQLRIAGNGPLLDGIRELVNSLDLGAQVTFLGQLNATAVADEMRSAHALVHSSDYETYSAVCAEALCCGTPVIASAVGIIPDLVSPDRGVLVPSNTVEAWTEAWRAAWPAVLAMDRARFAAAMIQRVDIRRVGAAYYEVIGSLVPAQARD